MNDRTELKAKNRKLLLRLLSVVAGMTLFAFALVPIYDVFCDYTGINGKTGGQEEAATDMQIDGSREISLDFIAMKSSDIKASFHPRQSKMVVHPGKVYLTDFFVKNDTDNPVILQAVPSVSPGLAALMLHKTECFCFNQQPLAAGEEKWMTLRFFLDTEFPEDIHNLTLQYTLYDITGKGETGAVAAN